MSMLGGFLVLTCNSFIANGMVDEKDMQLLKPEFHTKYAQLVELIITRVKKLWSDAFSEMSRHSLGVTVVSKHYIPADEEA